MAISYAGKHGLPGLCRLHAGYAPAAVDGFLRRRYQDAVQRSVLTEDERGKIQEIQRSEKRFHVRGRGKHGGVLGFTHAQKGRHHVGRLQYLCEFLYGRGQVRSGTAPCFARMATRQLRVSPIACTGMAHVQYPRAWRPPLPCQRSRCGAGRTATRRPPNHADLLAMVHH